MLSNDDIQAALITYLKAQTTLVAFLAATSSIKEDQWQGTQFVYPAYRLRLSVQTPLGVGGSGSNCPARLTITVAAYTEDASSKKADDMAGAANAALHEATFTRNNIRFAAIRSTGLVSAIRQDERTWRSEANFTAIIQ